MRPILFTINDIAIYSFGVFLIFGFVAGLLLLRYLTVLFGLNFSFIRQNLLWLVLAALIGARVFDALFTGQYMPWQGGLSLSGAIIATLIYFRYIAKKEKQDFRMWLDLATVAGLAALALGYFGYFLQGSGLGPVTSRSWLRWSVIERIDFSASGLPVVPLSLIMLIVCVLLALALLYVLFRVRRHGLVFCLGWTGYYLAVWLTERVRTGDDVTYYFGEANVTQFLAGLFFLLGVAWLIFSVIRLEVAKKKRRNV